MTGCNGISQDLASAQNYFLQCIGNPPAEDGTTLPVIKNFSEPVDKKYIAAALNDLGCIFYKVWPIQTFLQRATADRFFSQAIKLKNKLSEVNQKILNHYDENLPALLFSCPDGVEAGKLTSSECTAMVDRYTSMATDLEKKFVQGNSPGSLYFSESNYEKAKQHYQHAEELLKSYSFINNDQAFQQKTNAIRQKLTALETKAIQDKATCAYDSLCYHIGEENIESNAAAATSNSYVQHPHKKHSTYGPSLSNGRVVLYPYSSTSISHYRALYHYGIMCMNGDDGVPANQIGERGALDFFKAFLAATGGNSQEKEVASTHFKMGEIYCQAYGPYQLRKALNHFEEAKKTQERLVASNFYARISSSDEEKTKANDCGFSESELQTRIKDVKNGIKNQEERIKPFREKIQACRETINSLQVSKSWFSDKKNQIKIQTEQIEAQLKLAYQHGDGNAAIELAEMYETNKDIPEAAKWYGMAVEIGFAQVKGKYKELTSKIESNPQTYEHSIESTLQRKMAQQLAEQKQKVQSTFKFPLSNKLPDTPFDNLTDEQL